MMYALILNTLAQVPSQVPLQCNDGTLSQTCFCGEFKQGCCSAHGGVKGCYNKPAPKPQAIATNLPLTCTTSEYEKLKTEHESLKIEYEQLSDRYQASKIAYTDLDAKLGIRKVHTDLLQSDLNDCNSALDDARKHGNSILLRSQIIQRDAEIQSLQHELYKRRRKNVAVGAIVGSIVGAITGGTVGLVVVLADNNAFLQL